MRDDYFVLMNASGVTSNEKVMTRFRRFHTLEEAEKMIQDWLEYFLDVRCVPESEEAALRKEHYGMLPEDVFICPEVHSPADLTRYNNYYDLGGLGRIFNIMLSPIYDAESARQVCKDIDQDYGISGKSSEKGKRIKACLDSIQNSFVENGPVDPQAEEELMAFIERGGFSIIGDD